MDLPVTYPDPPSGGYWIRQPDGSLQPADETTATGAGLPWPPQPAIPAEPQE